jgi:hypothetical protein
MGTFSKIANVDYHFLFAEKKWKFVISVFDLQQTKGSCLFPLIPFLYNAGQIK